MMRFICATLLIIGTTGTARAETGRPASCLFVVKGQEVIRGECLFTPVDSDGSFMISGYNGQFFATVLMASKGIAEGYWNEQPYAGHAHTPLGTLVRNDACWANDLASVCAW